MNVRLSVIITIFGVEKFIERCAKSLFEQTMLSNIEFIFVDDCTKDKSIDILETLVQLYPGRLSQVKLLRHKENKGLPQARLTGLKHAVGDYIWFVDSDDWIERNACELIINAASKNEYDVVICDYNICADNRTERKQISVRKEKLLSDILLEKTNCSVWNKVIRRRLFTFFNVTFPTANMGEDLAIISQLFVNDIKVGKIDIPLYNYFINQNSISLSKERDAYIRRYYELKENTQFLICTLQKFNKINEFEDEIVYRKYAVIAQLIPIINNPDIYLLWRDTYSELSVKKMLLSKIPNLTKFFYVIIYYKLYSKLKGLSNKFLFKA